MARSLIWRSERYGCIAGRKQSTLISPCPACDGGNFSLQAALKQGPVLAAFFKVSCPVCQYTFPFLERLYQAHGDKKITIVGISQNNQRDTAAFLKEYGVTFPVLLDDPNGYAVSNAYGLTNVPTFVPDRTERADRSQQRRMGQAGGGRHPPQAFSGAANSVAPIFKPGEDVRDFRAG